MKLALTFLLALSTVLGQQASGTRSLDWRLHNLDLAGTRYSPAYQINASNVKSLTPRWLFQHGVIDGVSNQTTPIVVDGVMYVTDPRGSVYAVDAAEGNLLWSYDVTALWGNSTRGVLMMSITGGKQVFFMNVTGNLRPDQLI